MSSENLAAEIHSYSFGKIQNVGETDFSEEKNLVFHRRKISYLFFR